MSPSCWATAAGAKRKLAAAKAVAMKCLGVMGIDLVFGWFQMSRTPSGAASLR
jgi:hypothetical protein